MEVKNKIRITADRIIDLSKEELQSLDIPTMSCYIHLGSESREDMIDVTPADVFAFFERTGTLAKTAAKSVDDYATFFEPFVQSGETVIHLAASSGISSICEHAQIASKRFEDAQGNPQVYVVDTHNLSCAIAIIAKYAMSVRDEGLSAAEIYARILEFLPRVNGSFLIEDLVFLHKGGRCTTLAFYVANFLKIKPVIFLDKDGRMKVREKVKGSRAHALEAYIKKTFLKNPPLLTDLYVSLSSNSPEARQAIGDIVHQLGYEFENIFFNDSSCNSCVHSGKNTVGIFYINK